MEMSNKSLFRLTLWVIVDVSVSIHGVLPVSHSFTCLPLRPVRYSQASSADTVQYFQKRGSPKFRTGVVTLRNDGEGLLSTLESVLHSIRHLWDP